MGCTYPLYITHCCFYLGGCSSCGCMAPSSVGVGLLRYRGPAHFWLLNLPLLPVSAHLWFPKPPFLLVPIALPLACVVSFSPGGSTFCCLPHFRWFFLAWPFSSRREDCSGAVLRLSGGALSAVCAPCKYCGQKNAPPKPPSVSLPV